MFTVIRVYSMKQDESIVVVKDGRVVRTYHGVSEFTVADILQVAGVDVVIGSSMPKSKFDRQYKKPSKAAIAAEYVANTGPGSSGGMY